MNWVNWGWSSFFLFVIFILTGAPVTPAMKDSWFNSYTAKNTTYFAWLVLHYWLGAAFILMLIIGGFRNYFWEDNSKQIAFVWSFIFFIAGAFCVYGAYKIMPDVNDDEKNLHSI